METSILAIGINHTTAPLALRESLYFDAAAMRSFLGRFLEDSAAEGIVGLSTCNRSEFYLATEKPDAIKDQLIEALERTRQIDLSTQRKNIYAHRDKRAILHLCRVASGVDSMVVGEDQILKQLRTAYQLALHAGFTTSYLNLVFERSFKIAKLARAETRIGEGNTSIASVAVSFIQKTFSDLGERPALLIGAGETAELVARCLKDAGLKSLTVMNRTPERAQELAARWKVQSADFSEMENALMKADIVVCATSATEPILKTDMLKRVCARRGDRVLAAIDLSVPRNIEPSADSIPQLFVYDIEALEGVCEENRSKRRIEARKVEAIVEAEVERFVAWSASLNADAVIRAMRDRIENIRQAEIQRYGRNFHEHEYENLDRFTQSLLNKVLHDLTSNLKKMSRESDDRLLEFDALCRALNLKMGQEDKDSGAADEDEL